MTITYQPVIERVRIRKTPELHTKGRSWFAGTVTCSCGFIYCEDEAEIND